LHLENETIANFALKQSELWLPSVSQWLLIMPATAVLSFTVDVSDECFHLKFMERHLAKKHSSAGSKAFAATTRGLHNWSSSTVLSIWVSQQITQMMGIDT
jgi:hypothetical protein